MDRHAKSIEPEPAQASPELLKAFAAMWGAHPSAVMLIRADRRILAVNETAAGLGIAPGTLCHTLHPSDTPCPGCLADKALKHGKAMRRAAWSPQRKVFYDGYWIPVRGTDDVYVHFGNDITRYVREELLAAKSERD